MNNGNQSACAIKADVYAMDVIHNGKEKKIWKVSDSFHTPSKKSRIKVVGVSNLNDLMKEGVTV